MKVTLELDEHEARVAAHECRTGVSPLIADKIEAQLPAPKPAEPTAQFSVIEASLGGDRRTFVLMGYYWRCKEPGSAIFAYGYDELTDVTVLRDGVGTALPSQEQVQQLAQQLRQRWERGNWSLAEALAEFSHFAKAVRGESE